MFGLFKKKSELEKLESKYSKLLAEWNKLSSINRSASDLKFVEAQVVLDRIEALRNKHENY